MIQLLGRARLRACVLYVCLFVLLAGVPHVSAERLPIQVYGPAEGLPSTYVTHVMRDSRGFVWFSTRDGLSRFDGLRFVTYGTEDGLPDPTITMMLERRDGMYWIATNGGGVCRFDPQATAADSAARPHQPTFRVFRVGMTAGSNRVNMLFEDHAGHLWAGTDDGLYRLYATGHGWVFAEVPLNIPMVWPDGIGVVSMAEGADGTLWIGTTNGLVRIARDGRRTQFTLPVVPRSDTVLALLFDAHGRLWIGHATGLVLFQPLAEYDGTRTGAPLSRRLVRARYPTSLPQNEIVPLPTRPGDAHWYSLTPATLPADRLLALQPMPDGHIWLGTSRGLMDYDGARFHFYSRAQGLSDFLVTSLAADGDGNLWAATVTSGAMKLTRRGFRSYDEIDGLADSRVHAIFEDRAGAIVCINGDWMINRFDGRSRFTHAQPQIDRDLQPQWNSQTGFLDSEDRWWLLTQHGLLRLPRGSRPEDIDRRAPAQIFEDLDPSQLFEDRRGDIWIALRRPNVLGRWERRTGTVRRFTSDDGLPDISVAAITQDAAGNIWLGTRTGDLVRYKAGHFTRYPTRDGVNSVLITALYPDDAGRIWAGSNRDGLIRIDGTDATSPRFTFYSRANGLWSDNVRSIVADRWGRIYAGTARGIDRLDPDTGRVQHYTTTDGLLSGFVNAAFRDDQGDLWFGTVKGLSRLHPELDAPRRSPQVLIDSLLIAGRPQAIAQLGQDTVQDVIVPTDRRELQIAFFSIGLGAGEALRYRYMLEGVDRDWSVPVDQRTVRYSALPPRDYRFFVKAVRADGTESDHPAIVSFTVLPALWQRVWFQLLVVAGIVAAVSTVYRMRVRRLLALERVRTRIASDLHDDIGATLAQIAILSEVMQQQSPSSTSPDAPLDRIAQRSREAIASMSDIVWAINPKKDSLHATVARMREFASEVLPCRGIALQFDAPNGDLPMSTDTRRHLYLIFKEAVNNVLRHSGAAQARITLRVHGGTLQMQIADDGRGFDPSGRESGHGVQNMTQRAHMLHGTITISSQPGETMVDVTIPTTRRVRSRLFWWVTG